MNQTKGLPNIILIVLDTARADAFEGYGAPAGSTPVFAQLASSGVKHSKAIASCNWTMPSHVSMLSGLLPRTAGLSLIPGDKRSNCRVVLQSHLVRWLPEVLRRAGYATRGVSANTWVSKELGFDLGFEEFRSVVGKRVVRMHDQSLRARMRFYAGAYLARVDDGLRAAEIQMEQWLSSQPRPFFWFANLIECHSPYMPPRPYNDLGPFGRLLAGHDARRYQTLTGVWRACATGDLPPRHSLNRMRHLYHRSIRQMDDWLGRLCERLERAHVLDDTILIVTSDHGENFGEGKLFGHAVSLDDRLLSVPLVMAGPDIRESPPGVTTMTGLPRFIADAAGLDDHPWRDDAVGGIAVAQYDLSPSPDDPRLEILREWGADDAGFRRFAFPCSGATDGRYKLVLLGDDERLYDIQADPEEVEPMAPSDGPAEVVSALRAELRHASEAEWKPDVDALVAAVGPVAEPSPDELKELEDRMRLLGYL